MIKLILCVRMVFEIRLNYHMVVSQLDASGSLKLNMTLMGKEGYKARLVVKGYSQREN